MNKKILLTLMIVLTIALSIGTIYASDVNATGSYETPIDDNSPQEISVDSSVEDTYESSVDNDASCDVLKSEYSSTLSTNTEDSNVLERSEDNARSNIDVTKTVTSNDVTKYYKGSAKYTATFLDAKGNPLANTDVNITVNGVVQTTKTDNNGFASLDINLNPGKYTVVATNPVTGYQLTNTFTILSTIASKDISKVYKDNKKFSAKFLDSNGKPLAKQVVRFKVNGKTYKVKTDKNGVASISIKNLKKGTHKIISYNKDGLTQVNTIKVVKSVKTSLNAKDYTFLRKNKKIIKVKLLNRYGYAPPAGKIIKFKINGKTYRAKTNKYGNAKLKLPTLKIGVYTVKYSFSKSGYYKASSTKSKVTIIPTKNPTFTVKSTKRFGHGAGTPFKVALTSGKVPLSGKTVTVKLNGNSYKLTTNSKGIVSLPINLDLGDYVISYKNKADSKIKSKSGSTKITVFERTPSSISWKSATSFSQGTKKCKLLVLDSKNKPISNGQVKINVNSQVYTGKTNKNGYATVKVNFPDGNYAVTYEFLGDNENAPCTGTAQLSVAKVTTVSVSNIVAAASSLNSYYQTNKKLPNTVTAGGIVFTVPEFLYLMDQAIYQIGHGDLKDVTYIKGVSAPSAPSGPTINSKQLQQADFINLANNVATFIRTNNAAPNYASSAVGNIIYGELVDSSARILNFYATHSNRLPGYVVINQGSSGSSQASTGLNEPNYDQDLSKYLVATTNCQVGAQSIKNIVNKVTSGLTSVSDKANAIFNYVRDTISYSFYYNTRYGATGTLSSKKGNCVDHSHLLVAMFRTAGIPARYVHGTCKFTSGSTYGHVWVQVLVNNKWTVADATSSRNSLGKVANWNTGSFSLSGIYTSLSF